MTDEKKKVLIVDDDKQIHALLKEVFESAGYIVIPAFDAMQATMIAKQQNPDLLVLDIMMPAGGGFAVYDRFKTLPVLSGIPIMVYSAAPREIILEKIKEEPGLMILSKTTAIDQLVSAAAKLTSA